MSEPRFALWHALFLAADVLYCRTKQIQRIGHCQALRLHSFSDFYFDGAARSFWNEVSRRGECYERWLKHTLQRALSSPISGSFYLVGKPTQTSALIFFCCFRWLFSAHVTGRHATENELSSKTKIVEIGVLVAECRWCEATLFSAYELISCARILDSFGIQFCLDFYMTTLKALFSHGV